MSEVGSSGESGPVGKAGSSGESASSGQTAPSGEPVSASEPGPVGEPAPSGEPAPWLNPEVLSRFDPMLDLLASSHTSLSSVTEPGEARLIHVADSLSGLACPEVGEASACLDLGSGAGFPGIPLALLLPDCQFTLIDSVGRKVDFINEVILALGLKNARAVKTRSEDWAKGDGYQRYDLVTARAVAPLAVLAELASPLLVEGGHLVAWKGEPEPESERLIGENQDRLAMTVQRRISVTPYRQSRERCLYVVRKSGPTPPGLPRRPGMARKRPLGNRRTSRPDLRPDAETPTGH